MDDDEILSRADEWQRAIEAGDVEAASDLLADDYALVVTHPETAVMPRAEWLRLLPDYDIRAYAVQHRNVEVRAGIAIVVQRVEMTAIVAGADRGGAFVLVDVWVDDGGAWRVWRRHSTPLSAGPMPRAGS
jgi:ketosteroid isomerase-like protein